MAHKRSFPAPVVGGTSLLVIFAVLCLTVFSLLVTTGEPLPETTEAETTASDSPDTQAGGCKSAASTGFILLICLAAASVMRKKHA